MQGRVLIASNVSDFVKNLCGGYSALGIEPIAGVVNFELEALAVDILHILWPEELVNWRTPTDEEIDIVLKRLDRWTDRAKVIFTVNNLYPHHRHKNPFFRRLYTGVFERAHVIHHFGYASKSSVCAEYPSIADKNHIVRVGFNYERLLNIKPRDRNRARQALGIKEGEIAFLTFGALREWDEARCLMRAFDQAKISGKQLLIGSRLEIEGSPWRDRARRRYWRLWSQRADITNIGAGYHGGYVPDDKLADIFDAADAVLVIRQKSLNSGIVSLAMTFGRFVIAPNLGTMNEFVAGTQNLVYDAASWQDLMQAMEQAASLDREAIGVSNAAIAETWGWKEILQTCITALPHWGTDAGF